MIKLSILMLVISMSFVSCISETDKADQLRLQNQFDEAAELYVKAAEKGDGYAMWQLYKAYANGDGVEYNEEKAFEYLQKSADAGCEEAIMGLGLTYLFGWYGQEIDKEKGKDIITDIVEESNNTYVLAQYAIFLMDEDNGIFDYDLKKGMAILENIKERKDAGLCSEILGLVYLNGNDVVESDSDKGMSYLVKGFERGRRYCAWRIGTVYRYGQFGIDQNIEKGVEWYKKGVNANQTDCMVNLAMIYFAEKSDSLKGRYHNPDQAIQLLKKAMKHGNAEAFSNMGRLYYVGEYIAKDDEKAFECYKKATELNSAEGAFSLGLAYINGTGCEKDVDKGIETWIKAAELGNAGAANNLYCYYYHHEFGNPDQDLEKAKKYLLQAAKGGGALACRNIAYHYSKGTDLFDKNDNQAFIYMKKAADQGDVDACENLSYFYANGIGCDKDPNKAREYENKTKAKENLEKKKD